MRGSGKKRPLVTRDGLVAASGPVCFVFAPALLTVLVTIEMTRRHVVAFDFDHSYWPAGRRVLHGLSPYDPSWQDLGTGFGFPHSAVAALFFVPFALIPLHVADGVSTALTIGVLFLTLRVLRVRDFRIYGAVMLWPAVVFAWQTSNMTLLLGLGIAGAWRYRDRPFVAGALAGLIVSLKLFVWPIGLWLLATRRYAAFGWAIVCGAALNLVGWAVIGFDQISPYQRLVRADTRIWELRSYNVIALAQLNGIGRTAAYVLQFSIAAVVGAACVVIGRRGSDQSALVISVALCLLASPIIHLHYFALLVVPLAVARPKLSPAWLLPLLMLLPVVAPASWQLLVGVTITATVVTIILRRPTQDRPKALLNICPRDNKLRPRPLAGRSRMGRGEMTKFLAFLQSHIATRERHEDRGATMVEYGLLVAFIALVVVGGATLLGTQLSSLFSSFGTAL